VWRVKSQHFLIRKENSVFFLKFIFCQAWDCVNRQKLRNFVFSNTFQFLNMVFNCCWKKHPPKGGKGIIFMSYPPKSNKNIKKKTCQNKTESTHHTKKSKTNYITLPHCLKIYLYQIFESIKISQVSRKLFCIF